MKHLKSAHRWMILAVMTAPLFAANSCISNAEQLLFQSNRNNDVGGQVDQILNDVGDLVDSRF